MRPDTHTLTLTIRPDETRDDLITFTTPDAIWDGSTWNGYPAPQLPKWQGYLLDLLLGEDPGGVPSTNMDPDASGEASHVHMDGLCWEVPALDPDADGEPEPSELCRTCKELYWKAGATSADAQTFMDTGTCRACAAGSDR